MAHADAYPAPGCGGNAQAAKAPLVLLVPGLGNSGPDHWQSQWEQRRGDAQRVELGMWDDPHRNTWVNKLNLAIHRAGRPVVLVAHSLGCLAVAWWAEYEQPGADSPVRGALLVAPPDVDRAGIDPRLARFGACPRGGLPFPSVLVASRDDPYCRFAVAAELARDWGSRLVDAGAVGHINAQSGHGPWPAGERLLGGLLGTRAGGAWPDPADRPAGRGTSPDGGDAPRA